MSSPSNVVKLLQDTFDTQLTIIGQPNDDNLLLALKEKLLDVLQTISYDRADGVHHVVGVIQSTTELHLLSQNALACGTTKLPKTQWW